MRIEMLSWQTTECLSRRRLERPGSGLRAPPRGWFASFGHFVSMGCVRAARGAFPWRCGCRSAAVGLLWPLLPFFCLVAGVCGPWLGREACSSAACSLFPRGGRTLTRRRPPGSPCCPEPRAGRLWPGLLLAPVARLCSWTVPPRLGRSLRGVWGRDS